MNKMNINPINILITGANRGIGLGIVNQLIRKNFDPNKINNFPYHFIITTRSEEKGNQTLRIIKNNFPDFSVDKILSHIPLDITSENSINDLCEELNLRNLKLDILLNNAGVYNKSDTFSLKTYEYTMSTNIFGTINFTEKILNENILNKDGKIILVSSKLGELYFLKSEDLRNLFRTEHCQKEFIFELAEKFKSAIENGTIEKEGWINDSYHVSKMLINKYAQILTEYEFVKTNNIQVYSCTPGWVKTDMGGESAPLSIEEGVTTPIYLIELENKVNLEMQGKFISELKVTDTGL